MTGISAEEAIKGIRTVLSLDVSLPAQAWKVRRLDRPEDNYYLVVFGDEPAAVAVGVVAAVSGEVKTTARLGGRRPHLLIDSAKAMTLAGLGDDVQFELVWQPCRASRSPLYPLWQVSTTTKTVYVDQQGKVWQQLDIIGPGG